MRNKLFKEKNSLLSFMASAFFHLLLFLVAYFFAYLNIKKINPNLGYIQVFTKKADVETVNYEKIFKQDVGKKSYTKKNEIVKETEPTLNNLQSAAVNFLDRNADTTSLQQIYSESSLNISIKYPNGWTFIDQNVNKKLDGVTFWASTSDFNPPPYVHLEVCDRSLFNESRYKHTIPLRDAVIYFNDPENLADYYSQTFYFRTESDEDFRLKLTIKGKQAFNSYSPTFYGMLKSFKFIRSLF